MLGELESLGNFVRIHDQTPEAESFSKYLVESTPETDTEPEYINPALLIWLRARDFCRGSLHFQTGKTTWSSSFDTFQPNDEC